jgi:colanic acid biosynthesis glycosyl transferase WcaI
MAAKFFEAVSRFLLRKADEVIVLGRCMQGRILAKGIELHKVTVIPNWADGRQIRPLEGDSNPFRTQHELAGKFVVLYSGNMGRAHDFTAIFAAMQRLADRKEIVFVFIGSGARRAELEAFLAKNPEVNAKVLDYVPRDQLQFSMAAANIAIVAVADGLEGLVVPSKLYGIMASGRPPLYLGPPSSEAALTIKEHACGWVIENHDVEGFVNAILGAYGDRSGAEQMGKRARQAFELEFDRPLAAQKYYGSIRRVTKV